MLPSTTAEAHRASVLFLLSLHSSARFPRRPAAQIWAPVLGQIPIDPEFEVCGPH